MNTKLCIHLKKQHIISFGRCYTELSTPKEQKQSINQKLIIYIIMKHTSILAIVLCLLVSCNRNTIKIDETCGSGPDLVGQTLRFNLMNKSMTSTFNIYIKNEDDGTKKESVTTPGIDENMLQFFIKYCADKNIVLKDHIMAFVIYTDSIVSESMSVDDDQIKGITV